MAQNEATGDGIVICRPIVTGVPEPKAGDKGAQELRKGSNPAPWRLERRRANGTEAK